MTQEDIIAFVTGLPGAVVLTADEASGAPEVAWGDSFFFYDPAGDTPADRRMPFATIVTKDYDGFDTDSNLDRPGVFRLNIMVGRAAFEELIGHPPARSEGIDHTAADTLIPHPVYATQAWVAILNPGPATAELARSLLTDAHTRAVRRHRRSGRQPSALTLSLADRQALAGWAADCAGRRLPLFEARAPGDTRPREAIDGLRAFARGEMRIGRVRALAAQAHAAAREAGDQAAVAAARAAGHAAATAHMAAHARGAAAYAAKAAGLAAPHDPDAVAGEVDWQRNHASPGVREILRRLPPPPRSAGPLATLVSDIHTKVSEGGPEDPVSAEGGGR